MRRLADRLPEATRVSIRELRTLTNANSAATKNPFAATSRKTERSFRMIELVGANDNASYNDAHKVHECLFKYLCDFCVFLWPSVRWSPLLREHGSDVDHVYYGHARVPDRREVRYCTPAGGTQRPTPTLQDS